MQQSVQTAESRSCLSDTYVVMYSAAFKRPRVRQLAARFPRSSSSLEAAIVWIFDLQSLAKAHYYHPAQQGSWSIKKLFPCPLLNFGTTILKALRTGPYRRLILTSHSRI